MVKGDPRTTAAQEARRSISPDGIRAGMASGEQDKDKMKLMATWGVWIEREMRFTPLVQSLGMNERQINEKLGE